MIQIAEMTSAQIPLDTGAHGHVEEDILVWHKIQTAYKPSPREGHSAVFRNFKMHVFGGKESGQRTNSTITLDLHQCNWTIDTCDGSAPAPRMQHSACLLDKYMLIHGGEGPKTQSDIRFTRTEKATVKSSPKPESCPYHIGIPTNFSGVMPGDTLGVDGRKPAVKIGEILSGASEVENSDIRPLNSVPSVCRDDFFALDLDLQIWYEIKCSLAPLPRKGHTITLCPLQLDGTSQNFILLFGGYAKGSDTFSNSIHVCSANSILKYLRKQDGVDGSSSDPLMSHKTPLHWRSLKCTGNPPAPRYRHSATLIQSTTSGAHMLIIFGGITGGINGMQKALNDVHILDLHSLAWVQINTDLDRFSMVARETPLPVFGHVAFPILVRDEQDQDPAITDELMEQSKPAMSQQYNIIIFGGSTNVSHSGSGCEHQLYCFDTVAYSWSRVPSSYVFPPERCGHSMAVAPHWVPPHTFPLKGGASAGGSEGKARDWGGGAGAHGSVVIFGGSSAVLCTADVWVLDRQWRREGVRQFDAHLEKRVDDAAVRRAEADDMQGIEEKYLKASGSFRDLLPRKNSHEGYAPQRQGSKGSLLTASTSQLQNPSASVQQQLQQNDVARPSSSSSSRPSAMAKSASGSKLLGRLPLAKTMANNTSTFTASHSTKTGSRDGIESFWNTSKQPTAKNYSESPLQKNGARTSNVKLQQESEQQRYNLEESSEVVAANGDHFDPTSLGRETEKAHLAGADAAAVLSGIGLGLGSARRKGSGRQSVGTVGGGGESVMSVHDLDRDLGLDADMSAIVGGAVGTGMSLGTDMERGGGIVSEGRNLHRDRDMTVLRDEEMQEVGSAFLKVRKDRAMQDLQVKAERERAHRAEQRVEQLQRQLDEALSEAGKKESTHQQELSELRRALELSVARERQLFALNEETYKLLLLKTAQP